MSPLLALSLCAASLLLLQCSAQKADPDWARMIQALAKRKTHTQFLIRMQIANNDAQFAQRLTLRKNGITIFAPNDKVFASSPKYQLLWNSRRCSRPATPQQCYTPLCMFMIIDGRYTIQMLQKTPADKINVYWNTWQGDGLQKFARKGAPYGFVIGPQIIGPQCPATQCASRKTGGAIVAPEIYKSNRMIVHAIGQLLAPPSVWPNGFY